MREHQAWTLLDWYDAHARVMPWRIAPQDRKLGVCPNPYHVWLSEVMLQQTTVAAVRDYFRAFVARWPTVHDLAAASDADVMAAWAGLGYYARARNLLKCARVVSHQFDGIFPETYAELITLPGIGPYTASAIAAIAFDRPETVLDGNVERVISRYFAVIEPLPRSKPHLRELAQGLTPRERAGDYAQAIMDLGATICTPKSPACGICPWLTGCKGREMGIAAELPAKERKQPKPTRHGVVYVARDQDGGWLLERRPEKGMLGGMLGFVGSDWDRSSRADGPPFAANWMPLGAQVRHTFTHFHLMLDVHVAPFTAKTVSNAGKIVPVDAFDAKSLPTLMRKVHAVARDWQGWNSS